MNQADIEKYAFLYFCGDKRCSPYNDCQYGDTMIQKIFTFKHNCVRIRFLFAAKLFKEDCFPICQS